MTQLADAFLGVLAQLAPFLLLGFTVAGLLHAFVPSSLLIRALGGEGSGPILRGAIVGIPLPLCSCGVIPVAVELRKQGASRGAMTSFLVATPETGVDSISASVAVLHPLLVVFRPLAALVTAVMTGFAVDRLTTGPAAAASAGHCCHSETRDEIAGGAKGLRGGLRYAFVDLFGEVGVYLFPAVLITAVLTVWIQPSAVTELVSSTWLQMLLLLAIGVPVYVCAAAATPVAAGLIVAGFSPGAALVFLLAGPATNLVTISAVSNNLGRRAAVVYCLTIALVSLGFGALLNFLYATLAIPSTAQTGAFHDHIGWLQWTSAVIIAALVLWHLARKLRGTPGSDRGAAE